MRCGYTLALLCGLSLALLSGCGKGASNTEPMTEQQLAEQDKRVQDEEQRHLQEVQATAAAQPQNQAYGEQAPPGE